MLRGCVYEVRDRVLIQAEVGRFEHCSTDGDVAVIRRRFFDWLERRPSVPFVREELLDLMTSVVGELTRPWPIPITVTGEDGGDNVLLRFLVHEADDDLPARLGRGLAAADRAADRLSVDVVPAVGEGYVVLDVLLAPR